MMETERQNRVNFLLRKSAGERKKPEYRKRLATILDDSKIDFLPLEQSDAVREKFLEWVRGQQSESADLTPGKQSMKRVQTYASNEQMERALRGSRERTDNRELFVFLPDGDCTGALILPEYEFLSHAVVLRSQFDEMIYAVDPAEFTHALMIDVYDDSFRRATVFEVTLYGTAIAML